MVSQSIGDVNIILGGPREDGPRGIPVVVAPLNVHGSQIAAIAAAAAVVPELLQYVSHHRPVQSVPCDPDRQATDVGESGLGQILRLGVPVHADVALMVVLLVSRRRQRRRRRRRRLARCGCHRRRLATTVCRRLHRSPIPYQGLFWAQSAMNLSLYFAVEGYITVVDLLYFLGSQGRPLHFLSSRNQQRFTVSGDTKILPAVQRREHQEVFGTLLLCFMLLLQFKPYSYF
jgi:hypothetical protein